MDFRGKYERQADADAARKQNQDYRRMYEQILADNADLKARLDQVHADYLAAQQQVSDVMAAFEEHKASVAKQLEGQTKVSKAVEDMVTSSYQTNQQLMERYRADLSQRLERAGAQLPSGDSS